MPELSSSMRKHPDVAASYNNLGVVYDNKQLFDQALYYYFLAFPIKIRRLGQQHPSTQKTLRSITTIYENPEALTYFEEKMNALAESDEVDYGDLYHLGMLYFYQQQLLKAKEIFIQLNDEAMVARIDEILNQPE